MGYGKRLAKKKKDVQSLISLDNSPSTLRPVRSSSNSLIISVVADVVEDSSDERKVLQDGNLMVLVLT